ncbi:hypothetical protein ABZU32_17490 [Sphaerisporangium sp. NPDC005288]
MGQSHFGEDLLYMVKAARERAARRSGALPAGRAALAAGPGGEHRPPQAG